MSGTPPDSQEIISKKARRSTHTSNSCAVAVSCRSPTANGTRAFSTQTSNSTDDNLNTRLLQLNDGHHSVPVSPLLFPKSVPNYCRNRFRLPLRMCVSQGARATVEGIRHGFDTTIFISSTVLCVAWAFASVLRSRDHWREAAKPPSIGANGMPARRRLWWAIWPFFNLSFITAVAAFLESVRDGKSWSGILTVVTDDRLWNLVALAIVLLLVSYSVVRGAGVTLNTRKPNAEFTAGLLSAGYFSWFSDVIKVGQTKQLDLDDLPLQACYCCC